MQTEDFQIKMEECQEIGCANRLKIAVVQHGKKRGKEHVCDKVVCVRGMLRLHKSYHQHLRDAKGAALLENALKLLGGKIVKDEEL